MIKYLQHLINDRDSRGGRVELQKVQGHSGEMGNEGADWDRDGVAVRSLLDPSSCGVIPDPCARDEVREAEACGGGVEGFCVRGRAVF